MSLELSYLYGVPKNIFKNTYLDQMFIYKG